MNRGRAKVLVIGYGNPGRLDDGLGPALAAALEKRNLPGVTVEADYQLTVEDAAALAEHDVVVFADADAAGPEPYSFRRVDPGKTGLSFTSHSIAPAAVLALAHTLFAAKTEGYVLGIRGYEFDQFGESLSPRARANLEAATKFIAGVLGEGSFDQAAVRGGWSAPGQIASHVSSCGDR